MELLRYLNSIPQPKKEPTACLIGHPNLWNDSRKEVDDRVQQLI
jgi:hypothetical protein